ncbi:hypothetical protein L873DRAFT_962349 [Choiromyces venosus 120613-1]|uniref:Uncharacterized protein n=1 Tax=Choiromyces venosus 120613-1 TaxID=1336337 RepID=A0A3N4K3Y8_9PEZI|nr:hypothetical protein L873DRAFT_962349 [Choiromyces venosus 120613-1]
MYQTVANLNVCAVRLGGNRITFIRNLWCIIHHCIYLSAMIAQHFNLNYKCLTCEYVVHRMTHTPSGGAGNMSTSKNITKEPTTQAGTYTQFTYRLHLSTPSAEIPSPTFPTIYCTGTKPGQDPYLNPIPQKASRENRAQDPAYLSILPTYDTYLSITTCITPHSLPFKKNKNKKTIPEKGILRKHPALSCPVYKVISQITPIAPSTLSYQSFLSIISLLEYRIQFTLAFSIPWVGGFLEGVVEGEENCRADLV